MDKLIERINTAGMSREDWLMQRRNSIGGSDAAAIMGLSAYSSPYRVWADKLGRLPEQEDNEAMRQGRDLEDYVARRWAEATGKRVKRINAILKNPVYPFAHANVDRWVIGENAGLECKTTSALALKKFSGGEYPENYYAQCVHYMAVTGADRWYLGVVVLGKGFYSFVIERDQCEVDALMAQEALFWDCVEKDTPPPVDGTDATTDTMQTIYADTDGSTVDLFYKSDMMRRYFDLKGVADGIKNEMEEIKQQIMEDMAEAEIANCGIAKITWKPQTHRRFDEKRFLAENPNIDINGYYSETVTRVMRITEVK